MDAKDVLDGLVQPTRLWSRAEVLARPSPVPSRPGVYGWYFKELPRPIDTSQCVTWDGCTLLYGGHRPQGPTRQRPPSQPADPSKADPLPLQRQRRRLDPAVPARRATGDPAPPRGERPALITGAIKWGDAIFASVQVRGASAHTLWPPP
jgi:hypothetical protein